MMLKLEKPSQSVRDEYVRKLMPALIKRIKYGVPYDGAGVVLADNAKTVLLPDWASDKPKDTDRLKKLLVNEPADLVILEREINNEFAGLAVADRPSDSDLVKIMGYEAVFDSLSKGSGGQRDQGDRNFHTLTIHQ